MRVLYGLVCEQAQAREDGRVDVHGLFQQLYAPGFPAQQDSLTLAVAMEWDASEQGRQQFRIDMMDPDGSPALTISGHSDVGPPEVPPAPPQTRLIMPMEQVIFPREGSYRFVLRMDDQEWALAPLHLIQADEKSA